MTSFMERAIALGEHGRITAPPNPWVGCVIAKEGRIVGEGYHHTAGEAHAEVVALRQAGSEARGATAYVTLEPCCHYGRTPPCVKALIEADIAHVVIGVEDPDPRVSGKGIEALKAAGIRITTGISQEQAAASLQPYLHYRKTGMPYCVGKAAISIDGRTAAADRSSQWITSESARKDAHLLRAQSQAILVGANTARYDQPSLNVRNVFPMPPVQPLRVVLDSSGTVPHEGPLFDQTIAKTVVFSSAVPKNPLCEVIHVHKHDLRQVLKLLGERGVMQLMIEGGATILGSFLKASLIDQLVLYMGPCVLGEKGIPLFQGVPIPNIENAPRLKLRDVAKIDDCVRIRYGN